MRIERRSASNRTVMKTFVLPAFKCLALKVQELIGYQGDVMGRSILMINNLYWPTLVCAFRNCIHWTAGASVLLLPAGSATGLMLPNPWCCHLKEAMYLFTPSSLH